MLTVYIGAGPHTVRGLAEALNVSKPVITRALNKLSALGYLRRERDSTDRRNIFITRTPKGAEFLDAFHHFIAGTGRDERLNFSSRSEEHTSELQSLLRISYAVFCLKKKNK